MNVFAEFQARVATLIERRIAAGDLPGGVDLGRFVVEPPRDAAHGDLSTNAAMVYARDAKAAGLSPRVLAERLAADLAREPEVLKAEVARPGFINIVLRPEVYERVLRSVLIEGARFGAGASGSAGPVNVEYVSANPTGPLHVGHARGAVFGDALASLLIFAGREATRVVSLQAVLVALIHLVIAHVTLCVLRMMKLVELVHPSSLNVHRTIYAASTYICSILSRKVMLKPGHSMLLMVYVSMVTDLVTQ